MKVLSYLIIEDDRLIQEMLRLVLDGPEVEIDAEGKLASGIKAMDYKKYDVVLLDLSLGDSDGIQSLETVRRLHPDVPVVVLTGSGELKEKAMEAGAKVFIQKPPTAKEIRDAVALAATVKTLVDAKFSRAENGRADTEKAIKDFRRLESDLKGEAKQ